MRFDPELEIVLFNRMDVITTSTEPDFETEGLPMGGGGKKVGGQSEGDITIILG